ncbi:hypothetical protein MNB_SV-14-55 [hydrothermal vent metagenome]|uniref:Lipoprotein n=1 Tax=hydrothermal vent metagenome TaxID=652676 RepID=A0A1W1BN21_9ZZZZ
MKRFKILFIKISFLGLALQGCGAGGTKTKKNYPTAIGSAVSMTAEEAKNSTLIPKLSKMLQIHLNEINELEATSFSKTINYCDITGLQEQETFGTLENISRKTNYQSCENDNNTQNGDIVMTYNNTDEDGKFPKYLELQAQNDYNFNNITLKEGATIECQNISYKEDKSIESMIILINGKVEYNSEVYNLENHQEIINF